MARIRQFFPDQRRNLLLYRNGHGYKVNCPENKRGCHSNLPGPKRLKSGTSYAIFRGPRHAPGAVCPILAKITGLKLPIINPDLTEQKIVSFIFQGKKI